MSNPHESNSSGITDGNDFISKTLYMKPMAGNLERDDIVSHFSESASESDIHTIAGRRVEITVVDDNRPETTFWELNDDCIHGILSMECLSTMDLCSVAEISPRLKQIAGRIFKRKHAKCDLIALSENEAKFGYWLLKNFGAVISDLRIDGWHFQDNGTLVFKAAAKRCSSTLQSLQLSRCIFTNSIPTKLRPIFKNLQKLSIGSCSFEGASKEWFADCGSLVELELFAEDIGLIAEHTFPKLQKFNFQLADGINFDSFISRHKNLTSVRIWDTFVMSSLLLLIVSNCRRLEELEFEIRGDKTFDLSSLGNLRKLKIHRESRNVRGWNNLQFLENLTLEYGKADPEFIKTLSQMKKLQALRLLHCDGLKIVHLIGDLKQLTVLEIAEYEYSPFDVVLLIKRLSNLKTLTLMVRGFRMNSETYFRIVDAVRARPDKSKLTLNLKWSFCPREHQYDANMRHIFSLNTEIVEIMII